MIKFGPGAESIRTHPAILANIQTAAAAATVLEPHASSASWARLGDSLDTPPASLHNDLHPIQQLAAVARSNSQDARYHSADRHEPLDRRRWRRRPRAPGTPQVSRATSAPATQATGAGHATNDLASLELERQAGRPMGQLEATASTTHQAHSLADAAEWDLLADEFESFVEANLEHAEDKLNLAMYLNEYETNSCDLSELLTNLLRNLFVADKLKNPATKFKLLSYIKRLHIEPRHASSPLMAQEAAPNLATEPIDETGALGMSCNSKFALDLKLFDAMLRRYQLASQVVRADESMLFGLGELEQSAPDDWPASPHGGGRLRNLAIEAAPPGADETPRGRQFDAMSAQSQSRRLAPTREPIAFGDQNKRLASDDYFGPEANNVAPGGFDWRPHDPANLLSGTSKTSCDDDRANVGAELRDDIMPATAPASNSLESIQLQLAAAATTAPARFEYNHQVQELNPVEVDFVHQPPGGINEDVISLDDDDYDFLSCLSHQQNRHNENNNNNNQDRHQINCNTLATRRLMHNEAGAGLFPQQQQDDKHKFATNQSSCGPAQMSNCASCQCAGCLEAASNQFQAAAAAADVARAGQLGLAAEWPASRLMNPFGQTQRCQSSTSIPFERDRGAAGPHPPYRLTESVRSPLSLQSGSYEQPATSMSALVVGYQNNGRQVAQNNWPGPAQVDGWISSELDRNGPHSAHWSHLSNGRAPSQLAWSLPGSPMMKREFSAFSGRQVAAGNDDHHGPQENYRDQRGDEPAMQPQNQQQQRVALHQHIRSAGASHSFGSSVAEWQATRSIRLPLGCQLNQSTAAAASAAAPDERWRRRGRLCKPQSANRTTKRQDQGYSASVPAAKSDCWNSMEFYASDAAKLGLEASANGHADNADDEDEEAGAHDHGDDFEPDDDDDDEGLLVDGPAESLALVPSQAKGRLPMSVAEQMSEQASKFVQHYGSASSTTPARSSRHSSSSGSFSSSAAPIQHPAGSTKSSSFSAGQQSATRRRLSSRTAPPAGNNLQVRRTLRVKIRKSKPILGIAIEGGFNVSGQLLPRIVCVHEEGAAYQCGKLRASDLILEVNGIATANMTHDEIAETIATAYYQDERPYIEFLIGESVHV